MSDTTVRAAAERAARELSFAANEPTYEGANYVGRSGAYIRGARDGYLRGREEGRAPLLDALQRMRDALTRFGAHDDRCAFLRAVDSRDDEGWPRSPDPAACDCGLIDAALADAPTPEPPNAAP